MTKRALSSKLTGKQVRFLRGLGHKLKPVVMIGKQHITADVVNSVDEALAAHELIKVKLQEGCLMNRQEAAVELADRTDSSVAQVLGKTILLYRPGEKELIDLP